ncbi:MAG: AAA family ATPase [Gemmatimonadaceae bacterium]
MIESAKLDNFRCFRSASAEALKRINVIVGHNASGKTAFLEGLFFAFSTTPEIAFRLRSWRGLGEQFRVGLDAFSAETLWGDLFYNFDYRSPIVVTLKNYQKKNRSVRVEMQGTQRSAIIHGRDDEEPIRTLPIRFTWKSFRGENLVVQPEFTAEGGVKIGALATEVPAVFFHSTLTQSPAELAARYSRLSRRNEEGSVLEALQSEFPFVRALSVEVNSGVPTVYAAVNSVPEKIPIGLVSSGVNKLLGLLLAIAESNSGAVFVDEVENGFYYDRLPQMWRLLLDFCERHNSQLFCTTHSQECLNSLLAPMTGREEAFSLIRVERNTKTDDRVLRAFQGTDLRAAIKQHAEIR